MFKSFLTSITSNRWLLLSGSILTAICLEGFAIAPAPSSVTVPSVTVEEMAPYARHPLAMSSQSQDARLLAKQARPDPPSTPPVNQAKPGGGLDANSFLQACHTETDSVLALIPVENPVLTTSGHPSFLFYVPDRPEAIEKVEFSILSSDEKTRVYHTQFQLADIPGVVQIDVPPLPEHELQEDNAYHWYFKLYCQNNQSSRADLNVNGWVQRVELTPERSRQIANASPSIWYDAAAQVATALYQSPQDPTLQTQWHNLLESIGHESLTSVPLLGPIIVEGHEANG